jgi:hypothetical protein
VCASQLAVALLVLFVAYALQVRYRPYLSPIEREDVVRDHVVKSMSPGTHSVLAAAIKSVQMRGRKAARAAGMTGNRDARVTAALQSVGKHMVNYNTVEMVLLFCAVLICLAGVMFESNRFKADEFTSQKNLVIVLVMIVIVFSIVYCEWRAMRLSSVVAFSRCRRSGVRMCLRVSVCLAPCRTCSCVRACALCCVSSPRLRLAVITVVVIEVRTVVEETRIRKEVEAAEKAGDKQDKGRLTTAASKRRLSGVGRRQSVLDGANSHSRMSRELDPDSAAVVTEVRCPVQ